MSERLGCNYADRILGCSDDHPRVANMAECGNCGIKMNCDCVHTHAPKLVAPDFAKEVEVGTSLSENSWERYARLSG